MLTANPKRSLSEQAYDRIKDAICTGSIAPGDILSENRLSRELNMSRTPIREALRALSAEGFVEVHNGIGAYVKKLSSKDMEDLFEVRCLLELRAVRTSIYRITDEEIDDLADRFRSELARSRQGGTLKRGEFSELDWTLHSLLVERCTNQYIKTIVADNVSNLRRYQSMSFEALNDVRESVEQHLEILKYLKQRDLSKTLEVLEQHLEWGADLLRIST